ncbi:MAG: hypothetical protein HN472_00690 [Nitrospina sp.]|jgi:hypothetical protein|nr:hypothetical protein [Nitrospina sp.]MBT3508043.1 hypothetical protein [Nitrospina sp.]MBT3876570.1 hypothetical protein [Nitrospina sp.]MBT4049589.1 hypothetical protein [Nitrospina sp.]MBT4558301.1 hypothetical protein [Nitrospina sp.]
MNISIVPVSRIFKTYQGQARIAELNNKNPVKRVQSQRDRVSISEEAKSALTAHAQGASQKVETQVEEAPTLQAEAIETQENNETVPETSDDESFSRTNFAE